MTLRTTFRAMSTTLRMAGAPLRGCRRVYVGRPRDGGCDDGSGRRSSGRRITYHRGDESEVCDDVFKRPTLSPDPRAYERARPRAARDGRADDRPSRPRVRRPGPRGPRRAEADLQDPQPR